MCKWQYINFPKFTVRVVQQERAYQAKNEVSGLLDYPALGRLFVSTLNQRRLLTHSVDVDHRVIEVCKRLYGLIT